MFSFYNTNPPTTQENKEILTSYSRVKEQRNKGKRGETTSTMRKVAEGGKEGRSWVDGGGGMVLSSGSFKLIPEICIFCFFRVLQYL